MYKYYNIMMYKKLRIKKETEKYTAGNWWEIADRHILFCFCDERWRHVPDFGAFVYKCFVCLMDNYFTKRRNLILTNSNCLYDFK
jgi:hypothetical protein